MGTVLLDMAISLDGFVAGPNNIDVGLYNWYFAPAPPSAKVIDELVKGIGAMVMGKNTYQSGDEADGYADDPYTAARFILTHHAPEKVPQGTKPFIFVTDGLESALRQAQAAAGEQIVAIAGGANVAQQYLRAGLVDEIQLHIVSMLIGNGLRLFESHATGVIQLERTRLIESEGVTHIKYKVVK